jgi:hypothetical protein
VITEIADIVAFRQRSAARGGLENRGDYRGSVKSALDRPSGAASGCRFTTRVRLRIMKRPAGFSGAWP